MGLGGALKAGLPASPFTAGPEPPSLGGPLTGKDTSGGESVICFSGQQCFPASNGGAQPIPGRRPPVMPRAVRASRGPVNFRGPAASVSQVPGAPVTDVQP